MGSKGAPPPPNYTGAAQQQGASSQANTATQTQANRPDQYGPATSSTWSQDPSTGKWSQQVGLTGAYGQAADAYSQQIKDSAGKPIFDLGPMQNGQEARDQAIKSGYDARASRLDPMWGNRDQQLRTMLLNKGFSDIGGDEASSNALGEFGRGRNDAYSQAMSESVREGDQAAQGVRQMDLAGRQQQAGEQLQERQYPMQQLMQLLGLTSPYSNFAPATKANDTQYLPAAGMEGQYNLDSQKMSNDFWGSLMQSLGGLGGSAMTAFGPKAPLYALGQR